MTTADLARAVYERHGGISNKEASQLVDLILDFIKKGLKRGERIQITGFGTFMVREKKGRKGRNPQTGDPIKIKACNVVKFRPGKKLKDAI